MNRGMPATRLVKYFSRVGNEWEVSADLRRMITTQQVNLASPFPISTTYDVVFLRNVLIYFDIETKRDILRRVSGRVAGDGFLLLGSTETTLDLDDSWVRESVGRVVIHRPRGAPAVPPAVPTSISTGPTRLTATGA